MTEIDYTTHNIVSNFWAGEFSFGGQFPTCFAPTIPDIISYNSFEIIDDIATVVLKLYAFLRIKNISFNSIGFLWECSLQNEVEFEIKIYQYDSSGKKFIIEVLQKHTISKNVFLHIYEQLFTFYQ